MNFISKLSDGIFIIEKYVVSILVAVMCLVLFVSVALRYVFSAPLYWSGEVAIFSLVWVSFIGGSMGIKLEKAAAVTIVTDLLKGRIQKIIIIVGWAVVVCFCAFLLFYSLKWISSPTMRIQKTDALHIPVIYPYLIIPIGFLSLTIHTLAKFFESLVSFKEKENASWESH